LRKIH